MALNTLLVTAWITLRAQVCFKCSKTNLTEVIAFKLVGDWGIEGRKGRLTIDWLHHIISAARNMMKLLEMWPVQLQVDT